MSDREPGPLRSRTFRHLAAGYTVNEFGNWIADVALAVLVFDRTGSALATASLFLALRFAPAMLAPPLTARIETLPGRRVLPALYLAEAVIFGLIAALTHRLPVAAIMALAAIDGMLAIAAKGLTRGATTAALGSGERLRRGNAILNFGFTSGGAVGPALAGVIIAGAGPGVALALDAATFVAVAVLLASAPDLHLETHSGRGTLDRLRAGLREAAHRPHVRRLLIGTGATFLFGAAVVPIEVVFAKQTLHAGDTGYGWLLGAWGVGMMLGAGGFAAALRLPLTVIILAGIGFMAAGYGGLAASPTLAVACVCSGVGGIGNGLWSIAVVTAVQQSISDTVQSTVMAVMESINQVCPAVGFLLGGAITSVGSPRTAYAVSAAAVALVGVVTALRPAGEVRLRSPIRDAR
jgi:MFS family permease